MDYLKMSKNRLVRYFVSILSTAGLLLFSGCTVAATEENPEGFNWTAVIMIVILFAMIYFLILRPARKRQKDQQNLLAELKIGDKVIAAGGIYGEIESMDEDSLVIKVESGAKIRVTKQGIQIKR